MDNMESAREVRPQPDGKVEVWEKKVSYDLSELAAEKKRLQDILKLDPEILKAVLLHMSKLQRGIPFSDSVRARIAHIDAVVQEAGDVKR